MGSTKREIDAADSAITEPPKIARWLEVRLSVRAIRLVIAGLLTNLLTNALEQPRRRTDVDGLANTLMSMTLRTPILADTEEVFASKPVSPPRDPASLDSWHP